MKRFLPIITATSVMLAAPAAFADSGFGLDVKLSTLGLGVEASQSLSPAFDLRFGISGLAYRFSATYDHVDYNVDQGQAVPAVMLDWRPMQGRFRLTAGAAYYNSVLNLEATPAFGYSYTIGNNVYSQPAIGTLHGKAGYHTGTPYLGFGWDFFRQPGRHPSVGMTVDVGALYRNRADVRLTSTGTVTQSDLDLEAQNVRGDLSKVFPVVAIGASFQF
jgi:hypothetical protein